MDTIDLSVGTIKKIVKGISWKQQVITEVSLIMGKYKNWVIFLLIFRYDFLAMFIKIVMKCYEKSKVSRNLKSSGVV